MPNTSPQHDESDPDEGDVNAMALLIADHDEVKDMFAEYQELVRDDGVAEERGELVDQICLALTVHATLEEELFYPAALDALGNPAPIEQAEEEHAQTKILIETLQGMDPSDDGYDSTVQQLQDAVEAHVLEEEEQLFPQVRESSLDVVSLGLQMADRRDELLSRLDDEGLDD